MNANNSAFFNVSHMLSACLGDLGGQEFVMEWARENPTEFMQLYATLDVVQIPRDADPDPSAQQGEDGPGLQAVPVASHGPDFGAFDRQRAAEYLSISTRLLDDLLSAGTITRIKIGRKTLIRRIDLDDFLAKLVADASG